MWCCGCALTKEVFLALERVVQVADGLVGEAEVAVGAAHGHAVLEVPGQRQVLVIVPDRLLVVAQAVVRVTEEVARLRLALYVIQLLERRRGEKREGGEEERRKRRGSRRRGGEEG